MKSSGYIVYDETWKRLVRWVGADPALWEANPNSKDRGPTLFKTKREARAAIRATRNLSQYAWAWNSYVIYEVHS